MRSKQLSIDRTVKLLIHPNTFLIYDPSRPSGTYYLELQKWHPKRRIGHRLFRSIPSCFDSKQDLEELKKQLELRRFKCTVRSARTNEVMLPALAIYSGPVDSLEHSPLPLDCLGVILTKLVGTRDYLSLRSTCKPLREVARKYDKWHATTKQKWNCEIPEHPYGVPTLNSNYQVIERNMISNGIWSSFIRWLRDVPLRGGNPDLGKFGLNEFRKMVLQVHHLIEINSFAPSNRRYVALFLPLDELLARLDVSEVDPNRHYLLGVAKAERRQEFNEHVRKTKVVYSSRVMNKTTREIFARDPEYYNKYRSLITREFALTEQFVQDLRGCYLAECAATNKTPEDHGEYLYAARNYVYSEDHTVGFLMDLAVSNTELTNQLFFELSRMTDVWLPKDQEIMFSRKLNNLISNSSCRTNIMFKRHFKHLLSK